MGWGYFVVSTCATCVVDHIKVGNTELPIHAEKRDNVNRNHCLSTDTETA